MSIPVRDLMRGEAAEDRVNLWHARVFDIEYVDGNEQRRGADAWYTDRETGVRHRVQIKSDEKASKTGNCFIETVSVLRDGVEEAPGWVYTCQADRLLYWLPGTQECLYLRPEVLRQHIGHWVATFPTRTTKPELNDGYVTAGVCVPIDVVKAVSDGVQVIPWPETD